MSSTYLGLGKEAQLHLERFRSFLHSYYVNQHGYWPPARTKAYSDAFSMSIYRSMYLDFRNLYEYLADRNSGVAIQDNSPVDGGICVYQNVTAFNKRNKYTPLPHPLPLVPKVPVSLNHRRSFGLMNVFGNKQVKLDRRVSASGALMAATNAHDRQVMTNGLVREYLLFEKLWTIREETKVTCADARKVRWILIYAILQTLISVTRVPNEVRDTEGVTYPLCCQIAGTPPWLICRGDADQMENRSFSPKPLKAQITEIGPDMDLLFAKPNPLVIKNKTKGPSPPGRNPFVHKLSLKSPKPFRASSIEFLDRSVGGARQPVPQDSRPIKHGEGSPHDEKLTLLPDITVTPTNESPLGGLGHLTDSSTPSASETGGSRGWSASSSEADMEHASVDGSNSNYGGDDEGEEDSRSTAKPSDSGCKALPTAGKMILSRTSYEAINPELEQFLLS
ncbi:MAG: hypothetical protein Q9163_005694 [Psora crenata]